MFPLNYGQIMGAPPDYQPPADADLATDLQHPNLNTRDYCTRPLNRTTRMHETWEALALNTHGQLALGTNKVSGRSFAGSLWGFADLTQPLTESNACFVRQCDSLIAHLAYLEEDFLLVAHSSGAVQVWNTNSPLRDDKGVDKLVLLGERYEHIKPITALSVLKTNTTKAATGDLAGAMKVWDSSCADVCSTHTFAYAHSDILSGMDTSHTNEDIIATCGYDKRALLWDLRLARPAIAIYEFHRMRFNDIAWHVAQDQQQNLLTLGDESGFLHTLDVRTPHQFLRSTKLLERPIRKILPKHQKLGIIGNSGTVLVVDVEDHKVLYRNVDAQLPQRDGLWRSESELLTVGYDGKLNVHRISEEATEKKVVPYTFEELSRVIDQKISTAQN